MADAALEQLVEVGKQLYISKLYATAVYGLWIYDYLLTFRDEIEYAWNGRRSWVFALFIASRYSPVPYIIWSCVVIHGYTTSLCRDTKWLGFAYATQVVVIAKITIALRVYAVTEGNRWVGGALFSIIAAQFVFGIYSTVISAMSPIQQLPDINLDPFKFCAYEPSKLEQLVFVNIGAAFDSLAFLIIVIVARKPKYPGVPTILKTVLRDATVYFVLLFVCEIMTDFFIIFAPDSPLSPGVANTILIPLMISRLLLSLKKASVGPTSAWSFSTNTIQGISGNGTARFAPQLVSGLDDTLETPPSPNLVEEGLELEPFSRPSLRGDSLLPS